MSKETYATKLRDPRWLDKRKDILDRDEKDDLMVAIGG
jgi:hypothetical protein